MNKNEYARANKEWLAEKGKEEGVTRLAKGVCYKVLQSGSEGGKQPTPSSVVSCHYLGRTIASASTPASEAIRWPSGSGI